MSGGRVALLASLLPFAPVSAQSVRESVEIVDLSGIAIAPDGRYVVYRTERALIEPNRYELTWMIVGLDGMRQPRLLASAGAPLWSDQGVIVADPPTWTPDSKAVLFRALIDGEVQVWRAELDGGVQRITGDTGDVEAFRLDPDGKTLHYQAGASREAIARAERQEYDKGIRIDARIDPAQGLFRAAEINGRYASQRLAGRWTARQGLLAHGPDRHRLFDLRSGETTDGAKADAPPATGILMALDAAGRTAELVPTAGGMRLGYRGVGADAVAVACTATLCSNAPIVALTWRPGHEEIIFTTSDRWLDQSLRSWNIATGQVRVIAPTRGLLNGGRDPASGCAVGSGVAVCVTAAADSPPRLERIDLADGTRSVLSAPNAGVAQVAAERLEWRADSQVFTGHLFLPRHIPDGGAPLFVTYYLCEGYLRGGVGDEWPLAAMASAGIAALCINRASLAPGSDALAHYDAALAGVRSAVALLAGENHIDARRVGMGGLSFGSEATAWIAFNSDILAAASLSSTLIEPSYYWINGMAGRDARTILRSLWGLGAPSETPEQWQRLSPALNADKFRAPLLFQMPEQEFRLNMQLFSTLSHSSTPLDIYAFPHEPHIKIQPRHRLAVNQRNLDWFRFWLQGFVGPDPTRSEQYGRWCGFARTTQTVGRSVWPAGCRQLAPQASTSAMDNSRK